MQKRDNKQLILDYISGNDIDDYNIEELENNYDFMKAVIQYTNDKNIYELCSEELKQNYNFVKFLTINFKNDLDFITKVADYYLKFNKTVPSKMTETDINHDELIILMNELTKKKDDMEFITYRLKANSIYNMFKFEIDLFLEEEKKNNPQTIEETGLGFIFVIEVYGSSDIILKYFAEKYLINLLKDNDNFNLETMLHNKFHSFEEIERVGINKVIIDYINLYDSFLASYVSNHLELLDSLKYKLSFIKRNWTIYEKNNIQDKIELLFEKVSNYLNENKLEYTFNLEEVIYYITKQLGLFDKIKGYDETLDSYDEEFEEQSDYYSLMYHPQILSLKEAAALKEFKKIIKETLNTKSNNNIVKEYNKEKIVSSKYKTKILKFQQNHNQD